MVKYTQTIRRQFANDCLSVFDHFVGVVLKGLINRIDTLIKMIPSENHFFTIFKDRI